MKHYTGVFALALVLAFFAGMAYIGKLDSETKMKQEIECVQAGGQVQTFPHACIRN
jgi:hypothetical protein